MNTEQTRARLGMSRQEFAKELGVSIDLVNSWAIGRRKPKDTVIKLMVMLIQQAYNAPKCPTCNKGICTSGCANEDLNK